LIPLILKMPVRSFSKLCGSGKMNETSRMINRCAGKHTCSAGMLSKGVRNDFIDEVHS